MESKHLGEQLPALVDRVVSSYLADERTRHIDREFLPSTERAARINELLLQITYPGGFGRRGLTRHNILYHVGELLPVIWEQLRDEIYHCLAHEQEQSRDASKMDRGALRDHAAPLATTFI
ncbi:MAG: hypothetical protein HZB38_15800, partial [Planctomycetes bacterium]|nr:hypothetical protein [Planctomycetota bacterium]